MLARVTALFLGEGMQRVTMEEDVGVDLSVGVCFQKYEEPGPCGSAGDFLLGEEIEGEQPGREEVVGDALIAAETDFSFNFNGSNKCQLTSLIDVAPVDNDQVNDSVAPAAVNDIQEAAIAIDLLAAVDLHPLSYQPPQQQAG